MNYNFFQKILIFYKFKTIKLMSDGYYEHISMSSWKNEKQVLRANVILI